MIKFIKRVVCSFISLAAVMVYLAGTVGIFPSELGQWLYEDEVRGGQIGSFLLRSIGITGVFFGGGPLITANSAI